jgi:hypothetical protein
MIIYQRPNVLLITALVLALATFFITHGTAYHVLHGLEVTAWIMWGYDEARYGVNWFRHSLGVFAILSQLYGLIK